MSARRINIEKKIAVLRAARNRTKVNRGICSSLLQAGYDLASGHSDAIDYLRGYVMRELGGSTYLENWLRKENHVPYRTDMRTTKNAAKMLATRQAWIDWMIACYEEDLAKLKGGAA